jgi:hypothetical protein
LKIGDLQMDLLLQLQQDLADKINSESAFSSIWCGTYRAMVVAQEIEKRAPHLTGKNGSKGCGILVLMPTLHGIFPNVSPPQGEVKLGFWIVENPEINFNAGGTQLACEQVARMVRQCVNLFQIEGKLAFYQEATVMAPIHGLEKTYPGCCGYQVNMTGRMSETAVAKCALPTLSEGSLTVALATTDEGAAIYYTVDGTFPGAANAAPAGTAEVYTGPFTVAAGQTVRWAAYQGGYYGSDCGQAVISN